MKVLSQQLLLIASGISIVPFIRAQEDSNATLQVLPSSMSLNQFQTVLRTFLDDEMAIVFDDASSDGREFSILDGSYITADDDNSSVYQNAATDLTLEAMLRNRISSIEIDSNGHRRRILKNHHHRHRDAKSKRGKGVTAPHQRGRFTDIDPSSIPIEVNAAWDGIISHAWDVAKRTAPDGLSKLRGRDSDRRSRGSADLEDEPADNLFEDSDELFTEWSDETETLFLVCHSSQQELDGNSHLEEILTAAGKDVNTMGAPQDIEIVHSSPLMTCVILSIQPTYAWSIAERGLAGDSRINIAPWVDVMKISPELFDQILTIDESVIDEESNEHFRERGLRNFRRVQANTTEAINDEESLLWVESTSDTMENKFIVFSLTPPSTVEDAQDAVQSLVDMAEVGQRRRMAADVHSSEMSIGDTFSITGAGGNRMSSSARHWSRLLESGLESNSDCNTLLQDAKLQTSLVKSSYEFLLVPVETMNSTAYAACVASTVAGLAVNPRVLNVGIVPRQVKLDNHKAQWVLQGSLVKADDSTSWRRPFFEAGLTGQGQTVSVSDTGLDTSNCYFSDGRGDGNIFTKWDTTRRKVVRYDISSRGGDAKDAYKGHGSHVVGTLTGKHIKGNLGDGDDPKEGMAPAAKVHFFDIGLGNAVNDPREEWIESFYQNGAGGAKIASGSWGFGYRSSYDWVCRLYDQLVFDRPDVLHVSSAGNTGNQFASPFNTIGAPASCKNVFAVGATNNAEFGSGTTYVVDFSSRGPTSDGRTKPDIMAPGYALDSASSGYSQCTKQEPVYLKAGTSMATPVVAGAATLIRQYFLQGYFPCGAKSCSTSVNPSGALVKAVLANGARPLQGVQVGGTTTVLSNQNTSPYDNTQNMGISNLLTSLPLKNENDFNMFVQNDAPIQNGQKLTFDFAINRSGCSSDFAATIAWYDPPASNGCTKCLVNDLNLLVENLNSGKKYYPNGLSRADTVNNLERVRVETPTNGHTYRVTVEASMIGPGYTKQNFALVVTGCFGGNVSQTQTEEPSPTTTTTAHNLPTTYSANRKQAGNMFSIQAKVGGLKITSFAIHTTLSKTVKFHVYTLNTYGSFESYLTNSAAWTRISPSSGIEVEAKGFGTPTVIPIGSFKPVGIPKGRIQSFYITFIDETEMLYKSVNSDFPTGSVFSSDDAISIFSGVGKGLDFGATWRHRQMNGAVYYSITA